jgi:hypothetical protein
LVQVVECLLSKFKALSSNSSTIKKNRVGFEVLNINHCGIWLVLEKEIFLET